MLIPFRTPRAASLVIVRDVQPAREPPMAKKRKPKSRKKQPASRLAVLYRARLAAKATFDRRRREKAQKCAQGGSASLDEEVEAGAVGRRRCSAPTGDRRRPMFGHKVPAQKKTLHVRFRCGFRQEPHLDRTSRAKKNHRGDLAGGGIISQPPKTIA